MFLHGNIHICTSETLQLDFKQGYKENKAHNRQQLQGYIHQFNTDSFAVFFFRFELWV